MVLRGSLIGGRYSELVFRSYQQTRSRAACSACPV